MKKHYHWILCAGCMLMVFCNAGVLFTGFAVFQPYLISEGGLSDAQASLIVTIRNLFTLLAMFAVGPYYRVLKYRRGISLACMIGAFSFVLYSFAGSFPVYALAAAFAGIAFGVGGMIPVAIIIHNWFHHHSSTALALCATGTGFAGIVCPLLFVSLIEGSGLSQTFLLGAAFIALIAVLGFLLIRDTPQDMGLTPLEGPSGAKHPASSPVSKEKISASPAYCTLAVVATFFLGAGINPGSSHLSVLYATEGVLSTDLSQLMALEGVSLIVGKLLYGQVADRLDAFRASCIFFTTLTAGYLLCCLAGLSSPLINTAAVVLMGVGYSVSSVGYPTVARDIASPDDHTKLVKRFQISAMAGSLACNSLPGFLAELTGDYILAFTLLTALVMIGILLTMMVYLPLNHARKRSRTHPVSPAV